MNEKDWEAKFEMLFAEDLIQIDDDFFDEELCFDDPNDLNQIFTDLEEKNLYLIHQSQELEQQLENNRQQYVYLQDKLGSEVEMHKKNKAHLNDQITESQKSLKELKLRNQMSTVQTQSTTNPSDKNAPVDMEFNIEDLLNDLRADICRVYDKNIPVEKQPKQTIDLLTVTHSPLFHHFQELESNIEECMKYLDYIEQMDEQLVNKNEKVQKDLYKMKKNEAKFAAEEKANKEKNDALKARMDKVFKREGRKQVTRSDKPEVKREVIVVKIDQETLDRQRYLGEAIIDPNQVDPGKKKQAAATSNA